MMKKVDMYASAHTWTFDWFIVDALAISVKVCQQSRIPVTRPRQRCCADGKWFWQKIHRRKSGFQLDRDPLAGLLLRSQDPDGKPLALGRSVKLPTSRDAVGIPVLMRTNPRKLHQSYERSLQLVPKVRHHILGILLSRIDGDAPRA
jgi:hypothetical protein